MLQPDGPLRLCKKKMGSPRLSAFQNSVPFATLDHLWEQRFRIRPSPAPGSCDVLRLPQIAPSGRRIRTRRRARIRRRPSTRIAWPPTKRAPRRSLGPSNSWELGRRNSHDRWNDRGDGEDILVATSNMFRHLDRATLRDRLRLAIPSFR